MTERSRRVVLTGAGGLIGRAIAPLLPAAWDLLRTDLRSADGISALDVVTDADACRGAFTGADAVVHLAAVPARLRAPLRNGCRIPATRAGWWMGAGGRGS
jgi:nucleoside-diphosphate-sugar epimerase